MQPALYTINACARRINRQWKVTNTKETPELLITIQDFTSTSTTKLSAVPVNNDVYLVINTNPDFSINGSQQEIKMTLNATTKEWEAQQGVRFDANSIKYATFIYRPITCGKTKTFSNPFLPVRVK